MAVKIQVKRGAKAGLPTLAPGEWGLATDANEVYIGGNGGNIQLPVLGNDGKIPSGQLPEMGAVRVCRLIVGTSASGWAAADCDYLCDGTDDQVEINAAIQALPSTGGEIVLLDGTYNITATIAMNKDNVKLSGNGAATVLKRMWNSSFTNTEGIVSVSAPSGGCQIDNIFIDGNKAQYSGILNNNRNIYLLNTSMTVISRVICVNSDDEGVVIDNSINNKIVNCSFQSAKTSIVLEDGSDHNTIALNRCSGSRSGEIDISSDYNCVIGNLCYDSNSTAILSSGKYNVISDNVCTNNANRGISVSSPLGCVVSGNTCSGNQSTGIYISGNPAASPGYDPISVSGNTCCDNSENGIECTGVGVFSLSGNLCSNNGANGIVLRSNSYDGTISGNVCYGNGENGIYLYNYARRNTIVGNVCMRGTGLATDYNASQYTIQCNSEAEDNLIIGNSIMGKNYTDSGTNNTWANNKYE